MLKDFFCLLSHNNVLLSHFTVYIVIHNTSVYDKSQKPIDSFFTLYELHHTKSADSAIRIFNIGQEIINTL